MATTIVTAAPAISGFLILILLFQFASPLSDSSGVTSSSPGPRSGGASSCTSVSSTTTLVATTIEEAVRHNRTAHVGGSSRPTKKKTTSTMKELNVPKVKRKHQKFSLSSSTRNTKSDSLRRIRSEWKNVVEAGMGYHWKRMRPIQYNSPSHMWLGPLDERNLYIWHFTLVGLPGSPYGNGLYHGRIVLPRSYPLQPPRVQVWTPSGRFVPRVDICLSASHYHPETWSPTHWSIRTLVEALRLHMVTPPFEIGGMPDVSYERRRALAQQSLRWKIRIPLVSTTASTQQHTFITIDHEDMIKQRLFDGLLEEEEEAEDSKTEVVRENPAHTKSSSSLLGAAASTKEFDEGESGHADAERGIIAPRTAETAGTTRKRKNKSKCRSSHAGIPAPVAKGMRRAGAATASRRRRTVHLEPLGVRIVVAALHLVPLLVCLLLWRLVTNWFFPS